MSVKFTKCILRVLARKVTSGSYLFFGQVVVVGLSLSRRSGLIQRYPLTRDNTGPGYSTGRHVERVTSSLFLFQLSIPQFSIESGALVIRFKRNFGQINFRIYCSVSVQINKFLEWSLQIIRMIHEKKHCCLLI